jgi:hypothetical protein
MSWWGDAIDRGGCLGGEVGGQQGQGGGVYLACETWRLGGTEGFLDTCLYKLGHGRGYSPNLCVCHGCASKCPSRKLGLANHIYASSTAYFIGRSTALQI